MYKICIFDLDGTLLNTLDSIAHFANEALKQCGYETIPVDDYRYLVGNGVNRLTHRMMERVLGAGRYSEADVDRLKDRYNALYDANPTYGIQPIDGIKETVETLHRQGTKLAVLSNKPHFCTSAIINSGFPGLFDLCYGQMPEIPRKPAPDGALLIADKLGAAPRECLYIGDTDTDMQTGNAAGMDTVGVLWGFRTRRELEENHAKYIAQHPQEILKLVDNSKR